MSARIALLVALLLAPLALAAGSVAIPAADQPPPSGAHTAVAGAFNASYFVGPDAATVNETLGAGTHGTLWIALQGLAADNTSRHAIVQADSTSLAFQDRSVDIVAAPNATWAYGALTFDAPNATPAASYHLILTVYNGSAVLANATADGSVEVVGSAVAPAPAVPIAWYVGGGAVVLIAAIVAGASLRQRNVKRRMNEAPRRSQVMRDAALERQLEKAREKDPEKAAIIQQEIRENETVREQRRELAILEAKRADILKTMDLLRKRHEAGGLTKHQYDTMLKKRQLDLEAIEREIAESNGGSAAA